MPYAEQAVTAIRAELVRPRATGTVLCGHSQGSLLCLAAVASLDETSAEAVGVVTYGSPVKGLYAALFPAHVDDTWVAKADTVLNGRLRNLVRDTDPGAAPFKADSQTTAVDVLLVDVVPPRVHSSYEAEPEFAAATRDVMPTDC